MEKWWILLMISLFGMSGECEDFRTWLTWEAICACLFLISAYMIVRLEYGSKPDDDKH